jgi:protein TonB
MRKFSVLLVLTFAALPLFANEYVQTSLGQTLRLVGTASAPQVVTRVNPVTPPIARQAKMQGLVRLAVLVDAQGKVVDIKVAEGKWVPLNDAATLAVSRWKYKPTVVDGRPVPVLIDVHVIFSLR